VPVVVSYSASMKPATRRCPVCGKTEREMIERGIDLTPITEGSRRQWKTADSRKSPRTVLLSARPQPNSVLVKPHGEAQRQRLTAPVKAAASKRFYARLARQRIERKEQARQRTRPFL
jgi:hypothetical protein